MVIVIFANCSFLICFLDLARAAAFVQETFDPKQYKTINSLLEIENQTALVVAGAFAGYLLGPFGLHVVLLLNALTYLIAFFLLTKLDYVFTLEKQVEGSPRTSWVEQFYQSWLYIREKRGFLIFGVAALIPFIAVMLVNLLNPIFVSQVLGENVKIYALGEVTYSIGAVVAGFAFSLISRKAGSFS